jgi:hypothetical protein
MQARQADPQHRHQGGVKAFTYVALPARVVCGGRAAGVRGRFDAADLLATAVGALFAYATLILIRRRAMP